MSGSPSRRLAAGGNPHSGRRGPQRRPVGTVVHTATVSARGLVRWVSWGHGCCVSALKPGTAWRRESAPVDVTDRAWVTIVWDDPVSLMSYVTCVSEKLFGCNPSRSAAS